MVDRAAGWLALAIVGCAGAAPIPTRTTSLSARVLPTETQFGWIAGHEEHDRVDVILGSLRATLAISDDDEVSGVVWGQDRFAGAIRIAGVIGERWVFVAGDGTVASSATFTGPLRSIGYVPGGISRYNAQNDAQQFEDNQQHIWRCDGASIREDGPSSPSDTMRRPEELSERVMHALRRLIGQRYPGFLLTDTLARADGTLLDFEDDRLARYDAASGRLMYETAIAGPSGDCRFLAWGVSLVAECRDPWSLWRSRDERTFEPIAIDPEAVWRLRLSDDGAHGAIAGPCVRDPQGFPRPALCVLDGALREITLREEVSALGAVQGTRALVVVSHDDDREGPPLRWIDMQTGTSHPVRYGPAISDASSLSLVHYTVGPDELMTALVGRDRHIALAIGRGDRYDELLPLPEGVLAIGFADASHGFAAGADLGALYRTDNGGRSWSPIELDMAGTASASRFELPDGLTPDVECSTLGCLIANRVLIPFIALAPAPTERVLAGLAP